jgi:hypothetical protein
MSRCGVDRQTYDAAAFIHVISALLMPRSLPAKLLMTVMEPVRKLDMATAIVTDMTNKHSCRVDLKHSGRALGSLSLIGGDISLPRAASFSGSAAMLHFGTGGTTNWVTSVSVTLRDLLYGRCMVMLDEREVSEKMTRAQIIRQIIQRGISPRPGVPTGDIWEMSRICRQRAPLASIRCIPSIGVQA